MRRFAERIALPLALLVILCVQPVAYADDAPYAVDIVFIGLMTYVPGAGTVTMIMPNLKEGVDDIGSDHHEIMVHMPYVLADKYTMPSNDPMNLKHEFLRAAYPGKVHYHYLPLQGEEIAVDASNNVPKLNSPLTYNNYRSDPCPVVNAEPTKDTSKSLYWLSSMTNVAGPKNQDTAHFSTIPNHNLIVSRAILNYGSLEAHVISPGVVWDFKNDQNNITHTQALGQEVHWKFTASGDPFILNLFGFDGNTRRVAFKPQNQKLVIVIGNTTAVETGALPTPGNPPVKDLHYSAYYQFIEQNGQGVGPIPHPRDEAYPDSRCSQMQGAVTWDNTLKEDGPNVPEKPTDAIPKVANSQKKSSKKTKAAAATSMPMNCPQPTPGGLNCSGNQWP